MKVRSPHAYNLPGHVPLRKGESELGELPPAAKKYLDGLIKAGVVEVLSKPASVADKAPAPAPIRPPPPADPVAVDVPRVPADDDDAKKRTKKEK